MASTPEKRRNGEMVGGKKTRTQFHDGGGREEFHYSYHTSASFFTSMLNDLEHNIVNNLQCCATSVAFLVPTGVVPAATQSLGELLLLVAAQWVQRQPGPHSPPRITRCF